MFKITWKRAVWLLMLLKQTCNLKHELAKENKCLYKQGN
jgi:hypothetical protein